MPKKSPVSTVIQDSFLCRFSCHIPRHVLAEIQAAWVRLDISQYAAGVKQTIANAQEKL